MAASAFRSGDECPDTDPVVRYVSLLAVGGSGPYPAPLLKAGDGMTARILYYKGTHYEDTHNSPCPCRRPPEVREGGMFRRSSGHGSGAAVAGFESVARPGRQRSLER